MPSSDIFPRNAESTYMFLIHLTCTSCGLRHDWRRLQNLCTACQRPLAATYDLDKIRPVFTPERLTARREKSLWRFREVLPLPANAEPVSLGEGGTPLLRARRFGKKRGRSITLRRSIPIEQCDGLSA